MDRVYKVSEVAKTLEIGDSTLRKWMAALQENGYPWILDENGWRMIVESDLVALHMVKESLASRSSLDVAAREIASEYSKNRRDSVSLPEPDRIERLESAIEALTRANIDLVRELKDRDERRDRQLMETLRMMQEVKQLVAPTQEKKTGRFRSLFKRS